MVTTPDFDRALRGADVVSAGLLSLPTGRLVAAEPPGLRARDEVAAGAFVETVPPGDYTVEVLHDDGVVTAARVVVRPGPVSEWRPALTGDSHPDWTHVYFPVDGGTGSFGSVEVFETLTDPENAELMIADFSFDHDEPSMSYTDEKTGVNVIGFPLGGDGRYGTYVGYTANGEVACFLTDYGIS
ncbi:DUF4241 domain-containing protein [Cryptosporangium japonicum]|uniref:DUF4241 domain-containing protein n=1 Tax=Cryptosporangium japonicum TaxID=80872 RepID=A0ABP3EU80_9ACTN